MGKIGSGNPIRSQCMELIYNVQKYFQKEKVDGGPSRPFSQVLQRVSDATGVGLTKVRVICRQAEEAEEGGSPFPQDTPGKNRPRSSLVSNPDDFDLAAIRRRVHRFYIEGQLPTLRSLLVALKEDDEPVFSGCKESLRVLLTVHLGFKFKKINQRSHLLERTDVVALRHGFIGEIRKVDFENIVFLDETWVNENHSVQKCWQSPEETGLRVPIGKGKRLILLHAGTSQGFVDNSLLLFQSKSGKADYHDDMNAECFTEWFEKQLLPNVKPYSVIVMDNAPYHSVQLDKAPVSNSRKGVMQDWLLEKKIPFEKKMLKAELYELIKQHKSRHKKYVIDEMATQAPYFCRVIRLPPYHCQFNPIERVWADVKQYVAKRNTKNQNLSSVHKLTVAAIANVSAERWSKHVKHVKKEIDEYWEMDGLIEERIEPLIISINPESDESEDDSRSDNGEEMDTFESAFKPLN